MFDKLISRAAARAEARAAERRAELAARIAAAAPEGVAVSLEGEAVVMSGRGLAARFAHEAELRWLVAESRDG